LIIPIAGFFYQIYCKHAQESKQFITAKEFDQLKTSILFKDVGSKEIEERAKV